MAKGKPRRLLNRAFTTSIMGAWDPKTDERLDVESLIEDLRYTAGTVQSIASLVIDEKMEEIIAAVKKSEDSLSAAEFGRVMGLSTRDIFGSDLQQETEISSTFNNPYRLEKFIRALSVTAARGTSSRRDTHRSILRHKMFGGDHPHVKSGWARTVNPNPSAIGCVLDYAIVDTQYCRIESRDHKSITYNMVVKDRRVLMRLFMPEKYRDHDFLSKPKFIWDSVTGEFSIVVSAQYVPPRHKVSDTHVIGVDVGIREYASYAVVNMHDGTVVESGVLSGQHHNLVQSANATKKNIVGLHRRIEALEETITPLGVHPKWALDKAEILRVELCDQREALSRKRKEIAILAAREIRDISHRWGNAVVCRENMAWVGDTMENGRWNCGEFFNRLQEKMEEVGGRSIYVNAAYTSQECSDCWTQVIHDKRRRLVACPKCGLVLDRDINASINIANRGKHLVLDYLKRIEGDERYTDQPPIEPQKKVRHSSWTNGRFGGKTRSRKSKKKRQENEQKKVRRRDKSTPTPSRKGVDRLTLPHSLEKVIASKNLSKMTGGDNNTPSPCQGRMILVAAYARHKSMAGHYQESAGFDLGLPLVVGDTDISKIDVSFHLVSL